MKITIEKISKKDLRKPVTEGNLGFGAIFSNRMFAQNFTQKKGWHNARIEKYQPLSFYPATAVLHYSQSIFEGLKAYRRADGGINLFRPIENMKRFNHSAKRLAMPTVDTDDHLQAIMELVANGRLYQQSALR